MRRHAERLISARLWSALTDHEWQQAYATVASYEFKDNITKLASPPKTAADATVTPESRLAGSPKPSVEIRSAFESKGTTEPKTSLEGRASAELKAPIEGRPSAEPRAASEGRPSAEPKSASEARPVLQPSPRRDESRVLASVRIPSAASSTGSPPHAVPGASSKFNAPVPQRLPEETFPHADSFNLENIGRHWRVVLWFAMAAVGLAVVTYV
jgi:hypothetical protein